MDCYKFETKMYVKSMFHLSLLRTIKGTTILHVVSSLDQIDFSVIICSCTELMFINLLQRFGCEKVEKI